MRLLEDTWMFAVCGCIQRGPICSNCSVGWTAGPAPGPNVQCPLNPQHCLPLVEPGPGDSDATHHTYLALYCAALVAPAAALLARALQAARMQLPRRKSARERHAPV